MKLFHSISDLSNLRGPLVLAVGTFDGVHLGHQALIRSAQKEATECQGTAVVMTFDQHPAALLRPDKAPRLLTSTAQKIQLLEQFGVEAVLLLSFDQELAATTPEKFIQELASHSLKAICAGEEWTFGQGGKGNIALLRLLGKQLNFSVVNVEPVEIAGERISSTRLRQAIAQGHLSEAAAALGRNYAITGTVITGAGRGKEIGYPTANLFVASAQIPAFGVYAIQATVKGKIFSGVANIGIRPTIDIKNREPSIEAHIFDFQGDLYGEEMELELLSFLRAEQKFSSIEELKGQIASDIVMARKFKK